VHFRALRLDDISTDGLALIEEIRLIYDNYGYETEILAASGTSYYAYCVNCADVIDRTAFCDLRIIETSLTDIGLFNLFSKKGINKV
jgi:transaldolase